VAKTEIANLSMNDGSPVGRPSKEFRLPGTHVRVRRLGRNILLEPMELMTCLDSNIVIAVLKQKPRIFWSGVSRTINDCGYAEWFRAGPQRPVCPMR
jgi:hypothetical protein